MPKPQLDQTASDFFNIVSGDQSQATQDEIKKRKQKEEAGKQASDYLASGQSDPKKKASDYMGN